jgi:hypothetical protein
MRKLRFGNYWLGYQVTLKTAGDKFRLMQAISAMGHLAKMASDPTVM